MTTLKEWLSASEYTHQQFADLVPCSRSMITLICNGTARPSYKMALRIDELTKGNVPKSIWFAEKEEIKINE